jgi:hypothetical protein
MGAVLTVTAAEGQADGDQARAADHAQPAAAQPGPSACLRPGRSDADRSLQKLLLAKLQFVDKAHMTLSWKAPAPDAAAAAPAGPARSAVLVSLPLGQRLLTVCGSQKRAAQPAAADAAPAAAAAAAAAPAAGGAPKRGRTEPYVPPHQRGGRGASRGGRGPSPSVLRATARQCSPVDDRRAWTRRARCALRTALVNDRMCGEVFSWKQCAVTNPVLLMQ